MVDVVDDFNRADGGLGTSWTTVTGFSAPQIVSNQATGASGLASAAVWTANDFEADQHGQMTLADWVDDEEGIILRKQDGAASFYYGQVQVGNQQMAVFRYDAGTPTQIGATGGGSATWADGDTFGLEIAGTSIQCKRNGSNLGTAITDATYATGRVGFKVTDAQDKLDNFSAGPIVDTPAAGGWSRGGGAPPEAVREFWEARRREAEQAPTPARETTPTPAPGAAHRTAEVSAPPPATTKALPPPAQPSDEDDDATLLLIA